VVGPDSDIHPPPPPPEIRFAAADEVWPSEADTLTWVLTPTWASPVADADADADDEELEPPPVDDQPEPLSTTGASTTTPGIRTWCVVGTQLHGGAAIAGAATMSAAIDRNRREDKPGAPDRTT